MAPEARCARDRRECGQPGVGQQIGRDGRSSAPIKREQCGSAKAGRIVEAGGREEYQARVCEHVARGSGTRTGNVARRVGVMEAKAVPYTADELALFAKS